MLDWSKIDNEKKFQILLNHLFSIECNSPDFIPSSPYIGFDGGWDGYYKGYYPREDESGVWSIQAKWTTKSFNEAFSDMKSVCKEELRKSKENGVNYLRIGTNAELRVEHILELEELNSGEVDDFHIWHRENLSFRIEEQPFIRYHYFGQPKHPMLVPGTHYFSKNEPNLNDITGVNIKRFTTHLESVNDFLKSENDILIIKSNSSNGKSHLMRDISFFVPTVAPERQTWAINAGFRDVFEVIQDEISKNNLYLLLFDDAHRYLEELRPIFSYIQRDRKHVKIVVACRASGYDKIYGLIKELRCEGLYDILDMPDWSEQELIVLLKLLLKRELIEREKEIVKLYPNPLLVSWIGKKIIQEDIVDFGTLKESIINDTINDSILALDEKYDQDFVTQLMAEIAFIVPFYLSDNNVFSILSKYFKLEIDAIKDIVKKFIKFGILRYVGNSIRFNPDVVGDIYFADYCSKIYDDDKFEEMISRWYPYKSENIFSNIEFSSMYYKSEVIERLLGNIVHIWIFNINESSIYKKQFNLKLASNMVSIIPHHILNLVAAYLDNNKRNLASYDSSQELLFFRSLTSDDFGPIIIKLLHISQVRKSVINQIFEMLSSCIEGTYHTYKPEELIKYSVSPLIHNYEDIMTILDLLNEPKSKNQERWLSFVTSALGEILSGTHNHTETYGDRISIGRKYLNKNDEILAIREKGIDLVIGLLESDEIDQIIAGINIVRSIGITYGDLSAEAKIPLGSVILAEREKLVSVLGSIARTTSEYVIISKIENLFLEWWLKNVRGTSEVEHHLVQIKRSAEYLIFKYYVSSDYAVEDFSVLQQEVPAEDQWGWFVRNFMNRRRDWSKINLDPLVNHLINKYTDEHQTVNYLNELYRQISYQNENRLTPPIIENWITKEIELFSSIRANNDLWKEVPVTFKEKIDYVMGVDDNNFILLKRTEILESLPCATIIEVQTYLNMLIGSDIEKDKITEYLKELIINGSSDVIEIVTRYLTNFMIKFNDCDMQLDLISFVCDENKMHYNIIRNIYIMIVNLERREIQVTKNSFDIFKNNMVNYLKLYPNIDWSAQTILDYVITDISEIIAFLISRLSKPLEESNVRIIGGYQAIPFEGLDFLKNKILFYEDFELLFDAIFDFHHNEKFVDEYSLTALLKDVSNKTREGTENTFIISYFNNKIESLDFQKVVAVLNFIDFNEKNVPLFIYALDKCVEFDQSEYLGLILGNLSRVKGGFSSMPGEPPKVYVDILNALTKMSELSKPGLVKSMIDKSILSVKKTIKFHVDWDLEFKNRRR